MPCCCGQAECRFGCAPAPDFLTTTILGLIDRIGGCNLAADLMASPIVFEFVGPSPDPFSPRGCLYEAILPFPESCQLSFGGLPITTMEISIIPQISPHNVRITSVYKNAQGSGFSPDTFASSAPGIDCVKTNIWGSFMQVGNSFALLDWTGSIVTAVPT